jgi:cellulose synthase/poly-beta-1,6-N-acetylglucosamine synthase-like glycosyltransferase
MSAVAEGGNLVGYALIGLVSFIGLRLMPYFWSFLFHWTSYRQTAAISNEALAELPNLPFVKIQITTRGSAGTTAVIRRGIAQVVALAGEAPELYARILSVEVVTESAGQKADLEREFGCCPLRVQAFVVPADYRTKLGTKLKARALHYMVERRREGVNRETGRTFIVHFDEESVMEPSELRKLFAYLHGTDKKLTEGPIFYPLDYGEATVLCRAMEAQRPIGCFECRTLMQRGIPLHLHGSNLVIEEELENELGWDIGTLEGEPFIAEDYVFGVRAFLKEGSEIFGWHGAVMHEQPPLSVKSAFNQRRRWILGVLQGLASVRGSATFRALPLRVRVRLVWGTRFRVASFALGLPTGALSAVYLGCQACLFLSSHALHVLPVPLMAWMSVCGQLWLGSIFIGAWYNISSARQIAGADRWSEGAKTMMLAPVAGIIESAAGFSAVASWLAGRRGVRWQPTPKTREAERLPRAA